MSFPPMLSTILTLREWGLKRNKPVVIYLVSATTKPSSTQAMLVFTTPMSTTQAFEIPAPYVDAKDSWGGA